MRLRVALFRVTNGLMAGFGLSVPGLVLFGFQVLPDVLETLDRLVRDDR